jgi:class 3 adenylate cyclase
MTTLPGGTVTFVFTDIEGSTRLVHELGDAYATVLEEHGTLLREAFEAHGGRVVDSQGDAYFAVFPRARDAVEAAVRGQRSLAVRDWPEGRTVRVRMSLHTGEPTVGDGRYVGLDVHRAARMCAAAHGGQVLVSSATRELVAGELPAGWELRDLGEQILKDLPRAERVFQLVAPGLRDSFPPPRAPATEVFEGREEELAAQAEAVLVRPLPPALRASDADRERTVVALREHCAAGRLTLEEFADRMASAYTARTTEDLHGVLAGLPSPSPADRRRPKRLTMAVFGRFIRRGRWRVPRRTVVVSVLGDVDLDLRDADVGRDVVTVVVVALFGNVDVYVPEGVEVDTGGLVLGGHRREWGREPEPGREGPLIRVSVLTLLGTVDVWRVPPGTTGGYREIIRSIRDARQELPAG